MMHELLYDVIDELGAEVRRVVITALKDNVFRSVVELSQGGKLIRVDARPSDAVVLALRARRPIFACEELLHAANESG
jgi:bifunctional DNase/RNase